MEQANPPLHGITVVELADDPSGELVGLHLVRLGARVVKVEPPAGTASRHVGPWAEGSAHPERSLAHWYYNAGKESAVADLSDPAGRATLASLLDSADVFLCGVAPAEQRIAGIDLALLSEQRPGLVVAAVTPFGLTGPWADRGSSDLVTLATSGLLITSGYDDHSIPPIRPGGDQALHSAASFGLIALMLALVERERSGRGGLVDVSVHESAGVTVELANPYWFYPKAIVQRQTCRHAQPVPTAPALFRCGDGSYVYFALILSDPKVWSALLQWLDAYGFALDLADPAYNDLAFRQENFVNVQDRLEGFFGMLDGQRAYHEGQARGLAIGVLNAPEDLLDDEHLSARGFFVDQPQPGFGSIRRPGSVFRFSSYSNVAPAPAPLLGEHQQPARSGTGQ